MSIFKRNNKGISPVKFGDELDFTAHEAYRLLRTNLIFSFAGENKGRAIGIVSTVKGEGKTTTAINLSYVLAENGAKVCLVEADMRMPTVNKRLDIEVKSGLSELLTGQTTVEECIQTRQFKQCAFQMITAGRFPPNPAELLASTQMRELLEKLRSEYDFIIVDLPPVEIVSDPVIVGVLLDGVIIAVGQGVCKKKHLKNAMRQFNMANIRVLGFVRTFTGSESFSYRKRYRYKYYGNYGRSHSSESK